MLQYGQKSFLIVDDFTDFRTSTRSMLRELGVRDVDTADSGEQALRMCAQKRYDFILQDFHLGDGKKNGQQVLEDLIIDKHISMSACSSWSLPRAVRRLSLAPSSTSLMPT